MKNESDTDKIWCIGERHMKINIKDTLRALRQKEKITQKTLAAYLGITPQSVGKWERGGSQT